jgi:hypothetical protein
VYETRELPSEEAARDRRKAALSAKKGPSANKKSLTATSARTGPQKRIFNLSSYKPHALPDYAEAILMNGTTDNYSTQPVCFSFIYESLVGR